MMKRLITAIAFAVLLGSYVPAMAQYQNVKEKVAENNKPLAEFAEKQKTLFNFGWKFQLVTDENKNTDFANPPTPNGKDSEYRSISAE